MERGFVNNMPMAMRGNTALKLPEEADVYSGVEFKVTRGGAMKPIVFDGSTIGTGKSDREIFEAYYQLWDQQTKFHSSNRIILENENFKAIVNMGTRATPFIIEKLKEEPSFLVWALNQIYHQKVSSTPVSIEIAVQLWIKALNY